ncbi:hypothetical protein ZYGR_0I02180 [Zygosaccharomyces rouxii]|uniref:ZYRO0C05170p n=2 Tax=Zygosaccharomyces rouxii TaxID=4956 RepID=C5DT37_ZYGRC|nr:uncharacterized protein ZYRO0C05170g [Zygosaccharomyces rouxii]KAH9201865.1 hypothetical protein LQ764DRAFT_89071 [Zygosaccharomyces rouxii]GAV47922.1 hypothetical protein ZYGR_0I02180 [Zygosaccharomyces rouxii]CAR26948.1 ZYRO0C05170p [Zygosaccharomyces rouxii]
MIFGNLLTFLITCATLANAYHYLECVDSLPTSWTYEGSFTDQAEFNCYEQCNLKKSRYFAITGTTNQCYCGEELPVFTTTTTTTTNNINDDNEHYYNYKEEICGGSSSSYSLFSVIGSSEKFYRRDDDQTVVVTTAQPSVVISSVAETQAVTQTGGNSGSTPAPAPASSTSGSPNTASATPTGSGSAPAEITSLIPSTTTNAEHGTSIVYSTSIRTQSGSTLIKTVTQSATPSPTPNQDKNGKNSRHHVNVGAIVGGVVGGIGGAAVLTVLLLLLIRHLNKRREQERMEQEYQEAIKPVDFVGFGNRGGSTGGGLSSTNNTSDKAPQGTNTSVVSLNQGPSSSSFDDEYKDGVGAGQVTNPFDDSRRISDPAYMRSGSPASHKILTVVNPDEDN